MLEIERKFLVKKLPEDIEKYPKKSIKQWYLTKPEDSVTNRIRVYDDDYDLCSFEFKISIGHMTRTEVGMIAPFKEFEDALRWKPYLTKDRYYLEQSDKFEITIDVYRENLKGLYILEVEGASDDSFNDVNNWDIPKEWDWIEKEVSDDSDYSNDNLAIKNMIYPKDEEKLIEIVKKVFQKDYLEEAKEIIKHMNDQEASEVVMYNNTNSDNIIGLHFDSIKQRLVSEKILEQKESDGFGKSGFLDIY